MGHASVERILDTWQEEGIENSQEILKALDFSLDGNVNLTELTLALENELLVTKNGIHQAALASFKAEIRHLLERVDQVVREKEKLRSDLDKAEKLKSLMASEVDDHHAAIERRNEYNLRCGQKGRGQDPSLTFPTLLYPLYPHSGQGGNRARDHI